MRAPGAHTPSFTNPSHTRTLPPLSQASHDAHTIKIDALEDRLVNTELRSANDLTGQVGLVKVTLTWQHGQGWGRCSQAWDGGRWPILVCAQRAQLDRTHKNSQTPISCQAASNAVPVQNSLWACHAHRLLTCTHSHIFSQNSLWAARRNRDRISEIINYVERNMIELDELAGEEEAADA